MASSDAESHFAESIVSTSTDSVTLYSRTLKLETHLPSLRAACLKTSDVYRHCIHDIIKLLDEKRDQLDGADRKSLRISEVTKNNETVVLATCLKILRTALRKHRKVIEKAIKNGELVTDTKFTSSQLSSVARCPANSQTFSDVDEPDDDSVKLRLPPLLKRRVSFKKDPVILISDDEHDTTGSSLMTKKNRKSGDKQEQVILISDDSDEESHNSLQNDATEEGSYNSSTVKRKSYENESISPIQSNDEDERNPTCTIKKLRHLHSSPTGEPDQKISSEEESTNLFDAVSNIEGRYLQQQSLVKEPTDLDVEQSTSKAEPGCPPSTSSSSPLSPPNFFRRPFPFLKTVSSYRNSPSASPLSPSPLSLISSHSPEHSPTVYFRRPSPRRNSPSPRVHNNTYHSPYSSFPRNSPCSLSSPVGSLSSVSSDLEDSPVRHLPSTVGHSNIPNNYHALDLTKRPGEDQSKLAHVASWIENSSYHPPSPLGIKIEKESDTST